VCNMLKFRFSERAKNSGRYFPHTLYLKVSSSQIEVTCSYVFVVRTMLKFRFSERAKEFWWYFPLTL
jgi:hypothetical protein